MNEKELALKMLSMSVDERVKFVDAFVNVLQMINPRLDLIVRGEEE